jgi:uncharacterized membrane protein YraQ (UPF0718 family)/copper chaperone CopZ
MYNLVFSIARENWLVLGQMAPYLLFGFLAAGALSVCISPEFVERHLGGRGFRPVLKATLFGVPLVLCSCGVIPVTASVRRHGASRAAATSFLLSTPQTGIDSIAITFALLGPLIAVFRPIIAFLTGLLGGAMVWLFGETESDGPGGHGSAHCEEACCTERGKRSIVRRALEYGFLVLPRDIGAALLIGVLIAGVIGAVVPKDGWGPYLGGGIVSIVAMMLLGVPIYVCASASVPIAAGLIHAGASPGAALAFLISGPASNPATLTTVWKLLGRRTTLLYLAAVVLSAVGGGLLLDWLMAATGAVVPALTAHAHPAMESPWLGPVSAILLLVVIAFSYARSHLQRPLRESYPGATALGDLDGQSPPSASVELAVTGMTCDHCTDAVARALEQCQGVASVQVDLAAGRAVVAGEDFRVEELIASVRAAGYQAEKTGP